MTQAYTCVTCRVYRRVYQECPSWSCTPRQREASRHKVRGTRSVPRGCPSHRRSARARDLAPARLGPSVSRSASSVTLPQLDWSRPSRARTSARTRCAHPGKANTASANRGSAPSVLATDTAGTPHPRVPSLLGLPWSRTLTWRHCCTLCRPPLAAACPRRNGTVAACRSRQRGTIVQLATSSQVSFPNIPSHTRHFRSLSRGDKDACPHRRRKPSVPCRVRLPKPWVLSGLALKLRCI